MSGFPSQHLGLVRKTGLGAFYAQSCPCLAICSPGFVLSCMRWRGLKPSGFAAHISARWTAAAHRRAELHFARSGFSSREHDWRCLSAGRDRRLRNLWRNDRRTRCRPVCDEPGDARGTLCHQPDFEAPADANRNNVYDISFTASDGTNTVTQTVAITVTNVAAGFRVRRAITGLSAPIYATGLPDGSGRLVIVERAGRIRVVNPTTGAIDGTDFLNITSQVSTSGEKGLLSIAFSPNFLVDRTFYLHMNPSASSTTEIRKYTVSTTNYAQADAATGDVILSVPQPSATNHKGGTVVFDKSGRLLISLGDGGSDSNTAQDNNNLLGKILRIDPSSDAFPGDASRDYAIPPTNPFASGTGGRPEIYASGLRNPFRISVDPVTGDLFIADVGEGSLEEVNRLSASAKDHKPTMAAQTARHTRFRSPSMGDRSDRA